MERRAFDILEIEVTTDQKAIKKAYAKLAGKYHPEEYPSEWKRIHDAFEAAMQYAQNSAQWQKWMQETDFLKEDQEMQRTESLDTGFEDENYEDIFDEICKEKTEYIETEQVADTKQMLENLSAASKSLERKKKKLERQDTMKALGGTILFFLVFILLLLVWLMCSLGVW